MEVLSDVLRSLHVSASVYFCDRLAAPWSLTFDYPDQASFHLIRRGECWLVAGEQSERLGPGDFVFAGPARRHVLASERRGDVVETCAETLLLCGYCRFDAPLGHPLLSAFPEMIVVPAEEMLEHAWLAGTLDQISKEYLSQQPGSELVVDKLTEILVVELIRINFGRNAPSGFISALLDKPVASALALLHRSPESAWTIDELARSVGLSRAALAKRFKDRVGQTVFEYLTRMRMHKAQELLRSTSLPLHAVASGVGYESELAFAKAFKRLIGITPTRYRKRGRAPDASRE